MACRLFGATPFTERNLTCWQLYPFRRNCSNNLIMKNTHEYNIKCKYICRFLKKHRIVVDTEELKKKIPTFMSINVKIFICIDNNTFGDVSGIFLGLGLLRNSHVTVKSMLVDKDFQTWHLIGWQQTASQSEATLKYPCHQSSATVLLTMWDIRIFVSHEKGF